MPTTFTRHPVLRLTALALLSLLAATPALAQWKWRDASGHVQYSDLPPPHGVPEADILQRPASAAKARIVIVPYGAASAASAAASAAQRAGAKTEQDIQARQKAEKEAEKAAKAEQEALTRKKEEDRRLAEQRQQNCVQAKDQLRVLEQGVRVTRINEQGEKVALDDGQRNEQAQRVRTIIASECR